jgi:thymidylate kinase
MHSDRTVFIKTLFNWLNGIEYIWLKAVLPCPQETPPTSDIDLFIREKDLSNILLFIAKQASVKTFNIQQEWEVSFVNLHFQDGSHLKLDLLTSLVRRAYCYLSTDYLFANRVWQKAVATYSSNVLLEHALLFNYLNHAGLPEKYVQHFEAMNGFEQSALVMFINGKYGTRFDSIRQMAVYSPSDRKAMIFHLENQVENQIQARSKKFIGFIVNKLRSKTGLPSKHGLPRMITFTGVDGAGKTTLLNDLKEILAEKLQKRVVVLRHRPSLLPILSAYKHGKKAAEAKTVATLPRQGTNGSKLSSLLRFGYYYTDFLVGQVYVWLRYLLLGYTVVYDRYYFDFIVDGKRSNISLGPALPIWGYRFVAKPDLSIFLYADAETIWERKQELPKRDIELMTEQYLDLFRQLGEQYNGQYVCLENTNRLASLEAILSCYFSKSKALANPPQPLRTFTTQPVSMARIPC